MNGDDIRRRAAAELELRRRREAREAEAASVARSAQQAPAPALSPEPATQRSRPLEKAARAGRFIASAPGDWARGWYSGLSGFGQSVLGLGELAGRGERTPVGRAFQRASKAIEYEPELGPIGRLGQLGGRIAPEIAAAGGTAAATKAALTRFAPRAGAPVVAALSSPNRLVRGGATMAVSSPFDVAQGLQYEEGMLLPGRGGAVAENLALSFGAGAAFPGARRAATVAEEVPAGPITDPARLIAAPRPRTTPAGGQVTPESAQARLDRAAEEARAAREVVQPTPTDVVRVEPNVRVEVDPGSGMRTTYQWNEKEGRWVIRDRSRARRVSEAMRVTRDAEEAAALRRRLGGAGPQIPSIEAARQIEAAAESGRRLREAQPRPLIERPSVAGEPVFSAPRAEPPSTEFFTRRPEPATPRAAARPAAEAVAPAPAARATEEAVAPAPTARATEAPAEPSLSIFETPETGLRTDAAARRITEPVSPYPADMPHSPRTPEEWEVFYRRFTNDPEEIVRLDAQRVAGEIQTRQGRQSLADNAEVARQVADRYPDLAYYKPDQKLSGPELWALSFHHEAMVQRTQGLSRFMQSIAPDDVRMPQLQELRYNLERMKTAAYERLSRDASQSARDMRILRETKKLSNNQTDWLYQAEVLAGRQLKMDEALKLINLVDNNQIVEAQKLLGKFRQSTFADQVGEIYQSGLLTALMRPVRDLFSSAVNFVDKGIERRFASALDSAFSGVTGADREIVFSLRQFAPEFGRALKRGGDSAMAIMRGTGSPEALARAARRYDFARESIQQNPIARAYTTAIRRSIAAPDAVIYEPAYTASLYEMAEVFARKSEPVKSGRIKIGSPEYGEMLSRFLRNPPMEADALARENALQVVFQNRTTLGDLGMKLRTSEHQLVRLAGKVIVPFIQTPAAITTQTIKGVLAPAQLAIDVAKAAKLYRQSPEAIDAIARAAGLNAQRRKIINGTARGSVAWGWIALGYGMADEDRMTGLYPGDDRERRRWELDGRTEASIKLGGKWISTLGLLGPQAQLMAIGASMRHGLREGQTFLNDMIDTAIAGSAATAMVGLQTPTLQGVKSVMDLIEQYYRSDEAALTEAGSRLARTYAGGWVPQIVQQVARATDTSPEGGVIQREVRDPDSIAKTWMNAFIQGVPGARKRLPERLDMFGEPRATTVGGAVGVLSPARLSIETTDPVARELWRTNVAIPRTPRRPNESREEYEERATALGSNVYEALSLAIESPEYQQIAEMPVEELRGQLVEMSRLAGMSDRDIRFIEGMPDEQVRARLQGMALEGVVSRVRSRTGREYRDPAGGRFGDFYRTLTR